MRQGYVKSPSGLSVTPSAATSMIRVLSAVTTVLVGAALIGAFAEVAVMRHLHGAGAAAFVVGTSSVSIIWITYSRVIVDCLNHVFRSVGLEPDIDEDSGARLAESRHDELEKARREMFGSR